MAIFHLSVKYVSRGQGRSAVGAAAYRSGERLHNGYDRQTHDYTHKSGVLHSEIMLPDNAPSEYHDRQTLWNAAEAAEKRRDSRTAREIEIALPHELNFDEQLELVRGYVRDNFVNHGMCADVAIHSGNHAHHKDPVHVESENDNIIYPKNPHAHILLTTREVDRGGFKGKAREWDSRQNVTRWRGQWSDAQNREFGRKGLGVRVTHESHANRGLEHEPTKHLGVADTARERRGIRTDRGDENRAIKARNRAKDERAKQRERERVQNRSRDRDRAIERGLSR